MIKWLNVPYATKRNAYNQIAERTGMSPFAAEKDWWVVQTLAMVFETLAAQHLVFKGGTSYFPNIPPKFIPISREHFTVCGHLARFKTAKCKRKT